MFVHRIRVRETNCYVLRGAGGTVLIDPGPTGVAETIVERATEVSVQRDDVSLILVTHGHLDHYGSAKGIKDWCGAPVAACHSAPEFSQDRRNAIPPAQTVRGSLVRWLYLLFSPMARFEPLEADVLLDDGTDLSPYGVDASIMGIPGHSPCSLAVITTQGDAFVGDLFVNYTLPSQPIYLWDREAWQQSYERIRALQLRTVYVGHGDPFPGERLDHIYPARYQFRWWVR